MNLIEIFQDLAAKVPELLQPVIIALAGAVPFVEGEGAATIGIFAGLPPVVAVIAAIIGNFACVALLVLLGAGARRAVVTRRAERRLVAAGTASTTSDAGAIAPAVDDRGTARNAKFQKAFERYGVPGVSLLGPLLLPTQFTAVMLAAAGVGKGRILLWQGVAIVLWTTAVALVATGVISVVG